jgi:integrase
MLDRIMPLSPISLAHYNRILDKLENNRFTIDDLVAHPIKAINWIKKNGSPTGNIRSIAAFYNAIIWKLKEQQFPGTKLNPYEIARDKLKVELQKLFESQDLPETKKENMLEWSEVLALKEGAKEKLYDLEYVIYCLYTLLPPVRADYVVLIIKKRLTKTLNKDHNYLITPKDKTKWKFVFNHYKTSKAYGQTIIDIPSELVTIISNYIGDDVKDGTILFEDTIKTPNALSKKVVSIFKKLSNKIMGITLLRHSFITDYYKDGISRRISERKEISRMMMHSYVAQESYKICEDSESEE